MSPEELLGTDKVQSEIGKTSIIIVTAFNPPHPEEEYMRVRIILQTYCKEALPLLRSEDTGAAGKLLSSTLHELKNVFPAATKEDVRDIFVKELAGLVRMLDHASAAYTPRYRLVLNTSTCAVVVIWLDD